jgi:hypothetical protein
MKQIEGISDCKLEMILNRFAEDCHEATASLLGSFKVHVEVSYKIEWFEFQPEGFHFHCKSNG